MGGIFRVEKERKQRSLIRPRAREFDHRDEEPVSTVFASLP